eukprot:scaffold347_cov380-Prasinococcus_capsulatus_cf.AAC.13
MRDTSAERGWRLHPRSTVEHSGAGTISKPWPSVWPGVEGGLFGAGALPVTAVGGRPPRSEIPRAPRQRVAGPRGRHPLARLRCMPEMPSPRRLGGGLSQGPRGVAQWTVIGLSGDTTRQLNGDYS